MGTVELKTNLHELIDNIENAELLESIFEFLSINKDLKPGKLWESLADGQKKEVLDAYEESEDEKNLIPHSQVLKDLK